MIDMAQDLSHLSPLQFSMELNDRDYTACGEAGGMLRQECDHLLITGRSKNHTQGLRYFGPRVLVTLASSARKPVLVRALIRRLLANSDEMDRIGVLLALGLPYHQAITDVVGDALPLFKTRKERK